MTGDAKGWRPGTGRRGEKSNRAVKRIPVTQKTRREKPWHSKFLPGVKKNLKRSQESRARGGLITEIGKKIMAHRLDQEGLVLERGVSMLKKYEATIKGGLDFKLGEKMAMVYEGKGEP